MLRIMDYTDLDRLARNHLKSSRYEHSVGVAKTARSILERFGRDGNAGLICGIYHDWYRYISAEEALDEVYRNRLSVEYEEIESPMLLHGPVAACHMREIVGEDVPDRWRLAVRWHTLGSKDMGVLGAAVYVADFAEPGRKHLSDKEKKRILTLDSLEEMVLHVIESQNDYFRETGKKNAFVTDNLYSFLLRGGRFED